MTPIITPAFVISFVVTSPVEWASALGGVLIGNSIANDVQSTAPMTRVFAPPTGSRVSPIPTATAQRIGTIRLAEAVLEYRSYAKLVSTYMNMDEFEANGDGRVHTNYNSQGARTGRMSSDKPNLRYEGVMLATA